MKPLPFLASGAGLPDAEARVHTLDQQAGAIFSAGGKYRYLLWRIWKPEAPLLGWVMLNPSTADERELDPTLRRCMCRTLMGPWGGMLIGNLFALRSTDPAGLRAEADSVGPANDEALDVLARLASPIVCGWGTLGSLRFRDTAVLSQLGRAGAALRCLKETKEGHPGHPLYLPNSAEMKPWRGPRLAGKGEW
jgi:hypothetical protein